MGLPEKWIFITGAVVVGVGALVVAASPSLRASISTGREVRELVHFRERFRPERVGQSCPHFPLHRIAACARSMILEENRLHYASMTARIYYLSTIAEVAKFSDEFARTRPDKVEARTDLLEYLNDEMKLVLVKTEGKVDLTALDRKEGEPVESPEATLTRRYYANLVDLWIKNWRKDEKYLSENRELTNDPALRQRLEVLRADRDELFSRLSIDLSRYEKRRMPASSTQ